MNALRSFAAVAVLSLGTSSAWGDVKAPNPLADYKADREYDVRSPKSTFFIEQRMGGSYGWQTWIRPTRRHSSPYQLRLWHDGEIDWAGNFHVSPNEKYLLQTQKTGSGDNYGAIFVRDKTHRFVLAHPVMPFSPLSENAWDFFRKSTGLKATVYHAGIEFIAWGTDGVCVEISVHGSDCYEQYYVDDWRLHYNLVSHQFFQTRDQLIHNRHAIVDKRG